MTGPRLFVIAGEPSGDLLGAALIAGLRELCGDGLVLEGVGGPGMEAAGLRSRFPMQELSVMGIAEVLPRLPRLLARIRETGAAVAAMRPDALVTIDSPDFSLRVAKAARARMPGLRTIHYVAPSVWAWRPGRAVKMAKVIDHVLALLPFEPPYMEAAGMTCDFVGHPVAAEPRATPAEVAAFRAEFGLGGRPLLLLLPGSRRGEVTRLGPVFAEVLRRLRAQRPISWPSFRRRRRWSSSPAPSCRPTPVGQPMILDPRTLPAEVAATVKRAAFAAADAALAASGTVSLELAAQDAPMVIAYATNPITEAIARRLLRIDTATLVNLVTDTRTVPEFIFDRCRPELIAPAVATLLDDPAAAAAQRAAGAEAMRLLGRGGERPGLRAARSVLAALPVKR